MYHKDDGSVVASTPDQRSAGAGPVRRRWPSAYRLTRGLLDRSFLGAGSCISAMIGALGEAMKQPVERRLAAILGADVAGLAPT